jgi:hypothetical protein
MSQVSINIYPVIMITAILAVASLSTVIGHEPLSNNMEGEFFISPKKDPAETGLSSGDTTMRVVLFSDVLLLGDSLAIC